MTGIATLLAFLMPGCAPPGPIRVELGPGVDRPARSAIIFFADGLDRDRVDELIEGGDLPNIRRRFVEGGVCVENAIASMPSDTYPNTVSIITGLFPGHHGVLGNRWFDRYSLEAEYYITAGTFRNANRHFSAPTLFELVPELLSVAIQTHTRRGANIIIENDLRMAFDWGFHNYSNYDGRTAGYVEHAARVAARLGRWPGLIFCYFPGVDEIGHAHGEHSRQYTDALRIVDREIGRVADGLAQAGLLDSTYLVLVSDHGHVQYDHSQYVDVAAWLRENCGLRTLEKFQLRPDAAARFRQFDGYDAVVMNGAYRRSTIHLRGVNGWHQRPQPETVERMLHCRSKLAGSDAADLLWKSPSLVDLAAVEFAAYPENGDSVRILGKHGTAFARRSTAGGIPTYTLTAEAGDPLGYLQDPKLAAFVNAGPHNSREWLAATADQRVPDFVPQVVEMFDSHRAGDVVLFASDGGTFYNDEESGHGSCLAADERVVLFFAGPDLPPGGRTAFARNVDLVPTMLDLLGKPGPRYVRFDGVSIAPELRNATDGVSNVRSTVPAVDKRAAEPRLGSRREGHAAGKTFRNPLPSSTD